MNEERAAIIAGESGVIVLDDNPGLGFDPGEAVLEQTRITTTGASRRLRFGIDRSMIAG